MEKYGKAGQATEDNIMPRRIDAIYMLDNWVKNVDTHS